MQTIYLKDGRMAELVTKTEKGYLVDPYITWNDYEGQKESAPSGQIEMVSEVFNTAPIDLIEAEYSKVLARVQEQEKIWSERQKELQKMNHEISILRNQKTDLSRYIINREELRTAKRLIIWPTDQIAPRILDGTSSNKFSVSYEISQYRGEEKCWCYKAVYDDPQERGWSSYSQYFDARLGIKTDLTDEEILKITQERIPDFIKEFHSWKNVLLRTDDKWLTPEYIKVKQKEEKVAEDGELKKAQQELEKAQKKVDMLMSKALAPIGIDK